MIDITIISNAVQANVACKESKISKYSGGEFGKDPELPQSVMAYFMLKAGYSRKSIQNEIGASDVVWLSISNKLVSELNNGTAEFGRKIQLVSNYLKLNHGIIL